MRRVIALGYFDGVHLGHAALLRLVLQRAEEHRLSPAMLSFDRHPSCLLSDMPQPLLTDAADRCGLARRLFGLKDCIVLAFDAARMQQPWQAFMQELVCDYGAARFVVGEDFRCGYRGEGTPDLLCQWCAEHGCGIDVVPQQKIDGIPVSSTHIRTLVADGDMEEAARFLGHRHVMTDVVRHGEKLGRTIGAPTINQQLAHGLVVPRFGSYFALAVTPDGVEHPAVCSVGNRPSVSEGKIVTVESHLLDFSGDLYGREVRIEFCRYDAPVARFDSLQQLQERIARSVEAARAYFGMKPEK